MAKTLEQGFSTFIDWLKPLTSEREKSTNHRASVQGCMARNFGCSSLWETGSFGNKTGVRHYSDTDYFAVCPAANLYQDSAYTLKKIREASQTTFWSTGGIVVKSPAVRIPFGKYASERLELTPAYYGGTMNTPVGNKYYYYIPDYYGGWMKSSPGAHVEYVNREDKRLNGKLKPLIQMVKAWKFYNNIPIYSFYLELRVTKYAEAASSIVYDIDIRQIMKFLYDKDLPHIQDPMGISGYIKACKSDAKRQEALSKLSTGYTRANKAYENRENLANAFYWWNMFYNGQFPAR